MTRCPDVGCVFLDRPVDLERSPGRAAQELLGHSTITMTGNKGYSGVALHVSKAASPVAPRFFHPRFDHENRIVAVELADLVLASIYVPNGGKDFAAKLRFLVEPGTVRR